MISVPNLLPPLSGSKFLITVYGLCILLISCSTPATVSAPKPMPEKETSNPEVYNPNTKQYEPASASNTKVDTIQWKESALPPFVKDQPGSISTEVGGPKIYSIALLLPISDEDVNKDLGAEGSEKYFHYYAGVKMALEKLNTDNQLLKVQVFDLKPAPDAIHDLLTNPIVNKADFIVGPLRRDHLNETAKLSKAKNIPLLAPWNSFRTIENINENYVLLKSSLPTHCEVLTNYLLSRFKPSEMCLVGRDKSKTLMSYFQNEIQKSTTPETKLAQSVVKDDYKFGDEYKYLDSTKNVYIVTEFEDPDVVFNFLRHINVMRRSRNITVVGMPSWQEYSRDFMSIFSQLNVTLSTSSFADTNMEQILEFRKKYFKEYQNFPMREAYEGYDLIMFLNQMVAKYGSKFHTAGDINVYHGLATPYKLEKIIDLSRPVDDRLNQTICVENKALYILKFDQFKFEKIQ